MSTPSANELGDFERFVSEKVNQGACGLSPEEVLDEWRALHPAPDAAGEDTAAIQEALDDIDNGDTGIAFEEFDRAFRARRDLPPPS